MTDNQKTERSPDAPIRGSRWGKLWNEIILTYEIVDPEGNEGWGSYACNDKHDMKLAQCALHQRSSKTGDDTWRIQTSLDNDRNRIYFRRIKAFKSGSSHVKQEG